MKHYRFVAALLFLLLCAAGCGQDDIPAYPGAQNIENLAYTEDMGHHPLAAYYKRVTVHRFETNDSLEDVYEYYMDTMPEHGWEGSPHIPPQDGTGVQAWRKTQAEVWIAIETRADGMVKVDLVKGEGRK